MQPALEISDQGGQAGTEQSGLEDGLGQRGLVIAAAVLTPNAVSPILDHSEGMFHQLDLLNGALMLRPFRRANPVEGSTGHCLRRKGTR